MTSWTCRWALTSSPSWRCDLIESLINNNTTDSWRTCRLPDVYLDDLQLDALVGLRALEAVTDGLHQPVDQPLTRSPAVRGVACDVAVRYQLLQKQHTQDRCSGQVRSVSILEETWGFKRCLTPKRWFLYFYIFICFLSTLRPLQNIFINKTSVCVWPS